MGVKTSSAPDRSPLNLTAILIFWRLLGDLVPNIWLA